MKLRRIARAFPWRSALILALPLCFAALSSWAWFTWELPPLQRYYLRAYWDSSETANNPGAEVEVRWLELTAPGRKSEWPLNSDVTDDPFGYSVAILSYKARSQGWTGIEESPPYLVSSSELKQILQTSFYNRDLGIVESIGRDGTMRLRFDDERKVDFNPKQHPHIDHGYAVTATPARAKRLSVCWST